jgi:hypothetical protein
VVRALAAALPLRFPAPGPRAAPALHAIMPYDGQARLSTTALSCLDLRPGAVVLLAPHHNCQGAGQPARSHIGAKEGAGGGRAGKVPVPSQGRVIGYCARQRAWKLEVGAKPGWY